MATEVLPHIAPERTAHRPGAIRHRYVTYCAAVLGGLALVGIGTAVMSDLSAAPRWIVSCAGIAIACAGASRLLRDVSGDRFQLGFVLSVGWVVALLVLALIAPLLPIEGPEHLPLRSATYQRPDLFSSHPLGTDGFGRDYLARLIHGARVSLLVGVRGTAAALAIGTAIGLLAGYLRGKFDNVANVFTDTLLAFPPLVFLLAMVTMFDASMVTIFIAFTVLATPTVVRIARANTKVVAEHEFVLAARAMGAGTQRVLVREILPNVLIPLMSYAMVIIAALILGEASLSFLGLGIQPPTPSWGNMIAESQTVMRDHPHTLLVPSATLFLTVMAFNRLGEEARTRWDAKEAAL